MQHEILDHIEGEARYFDETAAKAAGFRILGRDLDEDQDLPVPVVGEPQLGAPVAFGPDCLVVPLERAVRSKPGKADIQDPDS